ncbi:GspE/PulE family protein [Pseudomonas chlororaphis]|uniref:GspE/PulE family protein n=1 Tax=Pseudomonas chlororaphis TaxID=587753 RepID=UPI002D7A2002|nr:ATPase, T2SS/T4P/T4SS family [Pseudomonas chlororaphis]
MTAIQVITRVLTVPGGRWEIDADLREKLCLTDDGVLHIVEGYGGNPFVLAFKDRLHRAGHEHDVEYVTPEHIKQLYHGVPVTTGSSKHYQYLTSENSTGKQDQVVKILRDATNAEASDVHFFATPNGHQLRFRVHGQLETVQSFAGEDGRPLMSSIYETMSESTGTSYRPNEKQDGRLRSEFVTQCGLFGARIATRPTLNGPWMAMRLLYDSGKAMSLDEMGYLPVQIDALTRLIHRVDGIVLLTGTTGSGKSRSIQTLLSMLLEVMDYSINLVTVEDPVEYRINGATQTPRGPKESWEDAISNMMRLDPDVGLIGEMRDIGSAVAAFQAALTGHMMWSTLHVNSAAASLQRLHDLGVEDSLVYDPGLVKGLVNQSLTRVLCDKCKVPYLRSNRIFAPDLKSRILQRCEPELVFVQGEGCEHCSYRGIINRTAIAEIIPPNLDFMRMFRERGRAEAQAFWVNEQGGITKNAHLIQRVNEGIVDPSHGERDVCPLDEDVSVIGAKA